MTERTLGFIGAGNMNTAILNGVLGQGSVRPEQVWLSNRHADKPLGFRRTGGPYHHRQPGSGRPRRSAGPGVKPQMFGDVLPELRDLTAGKCVVSIAAGISCAYLRRELPGAKVVRAMPNTPLMVGVGATAVARSEDVSPEELQQVLDLFAAAGTVALIDEAQMDDIINVNGSSPPGFSGWLT